MEPQNSENPLVIEAGPSHFSDFISNLPVDLLQTIVSRLPSTVEAISTSFLSRKWRYVWRSVGTLIFDEDDFISPESFKSFVNQTLSFHERNAKLDKLSICFTLSGESDCSSLDGWIDSALDRNVQDFDLFCCFGMPDNFVYQLPHRVFSSQSITTLRLRNCAVGKSDSNIYPVLSLQSVSLFHVAISSQTMERVLSSSPDIKILHLGYCRELSTLQGRHISLKFVILEDCNEMETFNMDAPHLQSFRCSGNKAGFNIGVDGVRSLSSVKTLHLGPPEPSSLSDIFTVSRVLKTVALNSLTTTNKILQSLVSNSHQLETLVLTSCAVSNHMKFCSHQLKILVIIDCHEVEKIEINDPKLLSFMYYGGPVYMFPLNSTCILGVTLQLHFNQRIITWEIFLKMFSHASSLSLCYGDVEEGLSTLIPGEQLESFVPSACRLQQLRFYAKPQRSYEEYLLPLLTLLARLRTVEVLKLVLGGLMIYVKFQTENPMELADLPTLSWTHIPVTYLQCHFKEVEIEGTFGLDEERQIVRFLLGDTVDVETIPPSSDYKYLSWKA